MSDTQNLNTGQKLQALWDKFTSKVKDESVAISISVKDGHATDRYIHIHKDKKSGFFSTQFASEIDKSHASFVTMAGYPNIGVSFNAETGIYSENSAWILSKLGHNNLGDSNFVYLGVKDEEGARALGQMMEEHIDNAYERHIGMPS